LNAGAEEDPFENPWGPLADELAAGRKARKTKIKLRSVPGNKVLLPFRASPSFFVFYLNAKLRSCIHDCSVRHCKR